MTAVSTYPWIPLARRAFDAARRQDNLVAAKLVERIAAEHGPEAIVGAITGWLDTLLSHAYGVDAFVPAAGVMFSGVDATDLSARGDYRPADGSQRPEVVWSGRMMAARAAGDRETWCALIMAVTEGPDATNEGWARHVLCLLDCAALSYNVVLGAPE